MKNRFFTKSSLALGATTLLLMSGCGGSGDGGNTTTNDGAVAIKGKAVDGYLSKSVVCLDLNLNDYCDLATEPAGNTDAQGNFELSATLAQQQHENFNRAPLLVFDGIDSDTGKRFEGKLKAPNDGSAIVNVTPLTTLVHESVVAQSTGKTKDQIKALQDAAEEKVRKVLKIADGIDIGGDPVALKSQGSDELIAASLSLQKSIQTLAKAAAKDSASGTKTEAELTQDMFEAFATGLTKINDADVNDTNGLSLLVNKAIENDTANLIPPKAKKVKDTAIKIGEKIKVTFEGFQADGESNELDALKNISLIIQQDLERLEKEFENFNGKSDFNASTVAGLDLDINISDDIFKADYDFEFEGFKYELEALGLSLSDDRIKSFIANSLPAGFEPWDLYERADEITDKDIKAKILTIKQQWEDEKNKQDAIHSDAATLTLPFTFYDFYTDSDNDSNTIAYSKVEFTTNNTLSFSEYSFNGATWANTNDDSDLILTANGWASESNSPVFEYNSTTNKIKLPHEEATVSAEIDLKDNTIFVEGLNDGVVMPAGAVKRYISIKKIEDTYSLWDVEKNYENNSTYPTLQEFIASKQGSDQFIGDHNGGIGFKNDPNETTSGTLVEWSNVNNQKEIIDQNAGTWAIKTISGVEILVVTPNDPYRYSEDDNLEYPIFSVHNSVVYGGGKEVASDDVVTFPVFNETAFNVIKSYIEAHPPVSGFSQEMLVGKTFYFATEPKNNKTPYISNATFNEDNTTTYVRDGNTTTESWNIDNGKLIISGITIQLEINQQWGGAKYAATIFDQSGNEIAKRLIFETKASRDAFAQDYMNNGGGDSTTSSNEGDSNTSSNGGGESLLVPTNLGEENTSITSFPDSMNGVVFYDVDSECIEENATEKCTNTPYVGKATFNDTTFTWVNVDDSNDTETENYTKDGNVITFMKDNGDTVDTKVTFAKQYANGLKLFFEDNDNGKLYKGTFYVFFSLEEARKYASQLTK